MDPDHGRSPPGRVRVRPVWTPFRPGPPTRPARRSRSSGILPLGCVEFVRNGVDCCVHLVRRRRIPTGMRSVRRTHPMSMEYERTVPPTAVVTSVDPPPMSTTTDRLPPGRSAVAASEREPPLLRARQDLGREPDDLAGWFQERLAVGGVADRRGGDEPGSLDALGIHDGAVLAERGERAFQRLGSKPVRRVNALSQASDPHLARPDISVRADDEQPRGIGSAVECRQRTGTPHQAEYPRAPMIRSPPGSARAAPPPTPRPRRPRRPATMPRPRGGT